MSPQEATKVHLKIKKEEEDGGHEGSSSSRRPHLTFLYFGGCFYSYYYNYLFNWTLLLGAKRGASRRNLSRDGNWVPPPPNISFLRKHADPPALVLLSVPIRHVTLPLCAVLFFMIYIPQYKTILFFFLIVPFVSCYFTSNYNFPSNLLN